MANIKLFQNIKFIFFKCQSVDINILNLGNIKLSSFSNDWQAICFSVKIIVQVKNIYSVGIVVYLGNWI